MNVLGLTNIINPNHEVNKTLNAFAFGAGTYKTVYFNRWGTQLENNQGLILETGNVIGHPAPILSPKTDLSPGTYFYNTQFTSCNGIDKQVFNGYFTIISPTSRMKIDSFPIDDTLFSYKFEENTKEEFKFRKRANKKKCYLGD